MEVVFIPRNLMLVFLIAVFMFIAVIMVVVVMMVRTYRFIKLI